MDIVEIINRYGFPTFAVIALGYLIHYIWKWVTLEIKPVVSETSKVLVELIDQIRMLDNDLIRLNQKVNVVMSLRKEDKHETNKCCCCPNGSNCSKRD